MPQMAPIAWLNLFLIFFSTLLIFNMLNYYTFNTNTPKSNYIENSQYMNSLNWKW